MSLKIALLFSRLQFHPEDTVKPDGSLSLPYLAGALRDAGFPVRIIDCAVGTEQDDLTTTFLQPTPLPSGLVRVGLSDARILEEVKDADLIGITSIFTVQTTPVLEMIRLIHQAYPMKCIIAGGVNARELRARFFDAGCDMVATSEAEETIVHIARGLAAGRGLDMVQGVATSFASPGPPPPRTDLDALPYPAWDLMPLQRYWRISRPHGGAFPTGETIKYASLMTSRGCPFVCSYCHISKEGDGSLSGPIGTWRSKSVERVLVEARRLKALGAEWIFLEDDSLLAKKQRALDIFAGLADLGLKLADVNGVNIAHLMRKDGGALHVDRPLLEAMAACGFRQLTLPFEAGTQRVIDRWASKKWRVETSPVTALVEACRDVGILPLANFTLGYPDESFEEVLATLKLARDVMAAGAEAASFFIIVPFPGTTLFDEAVAEGYLSQDFDPDQMSWNRALMRNTKIAPETLEAVRTTAWTILNRPEFVKSKVKLAPQGMAA